MFIVQSSIYVWHSCQFCILPQMLQIVILSHVGQEDMHQHVGLVHSHPLRSLQTYHVGGLLLELLVTHVANRLCYRLYLCG